jgi:hypothetical protein
VSPVFATGATATLDTRPVSGHVRQNKQHFLPNDNWLMVPGVVIFANDKLFRVLKMTCQNVATCSAYLNTKDLHTST